MAIADDFTINYGAKTITHTSGATAKPIWRGGRNDYQKRGPGLP